MMMMQVSGGAISDALVSVPSTSCYRSLDHRNFPSFFDHKPHYLTPTKSCGSFSVGKISGGQDKCKSKGFVVRCSYNSGENLAPIAPADLESPAGQLLTQLLQTHPHLAPAAIDQQLENLQNDREAQKAESPTSAQELPLYRRIAEVREKERRKTLEEILYCLIVQKFVENDISMIPKMSPSSDPTGRVDFWPNQEQKLESVHSPEVLEMVHSHLSVLLSDRLVGPLETLIEISKVKLGKLYAATIMYGYFLRRVDQRYQLERAMKTLPEDLGKKTVASDDPVPQSPFWDPDSSVQIPVDEDEYVSYDELMNIGDEESNKLKAYVMYLDTDTLEKYASLRSPEAVSVIEKQTQSLFGKPNIRVNDGGSLEAQNDEIIKVSYAGFTMLILEAVAIGSFLWDAEDYVESKYSFILN